MKKASSNLLLLDVNVLLALAWPNHQFHGAATRWLGPSSDPWATCALTQLGFIRLSSNPAVVSPAKSPAAAAALLEAMVRDPLHQYLSALPAPAVRGTVPFEKIIGSKQVTDLYLLTLAHRHNATFVTFDSRLKALAGADGRIQTLGL